MLIQNNGMVVCQPTPQKATQVIAQQISDRDTNVRNAALNTLVIIYDNIGETVYKYAGQVSICVCARGCVRAYIKVDSGDPGYFGHVCHMGLHSTGQVFTILNVNNISDCTIRDLISKVPYNQIFFAGN